MFALTVGPNVIRFLLPLFLEDDDLNETIDTISYTLDCVSYYGLPHTDYAIFGIIYGTQTETNSTKPNDAAHLPPCRGNTSRVRGSFAAACRLR